MTRVLRPNFGPAARRALRLPSLPTLHGAVGLLALLASLALAPAVRAHDLYTSWANATLRGDRLLLTLTLSRANALRLLPASDESAPITPENFARYAAKLKAAAPGLFTISSANQTLKLISATAGLAGDDDVTFQLAYTWQGTITGRLRFTAHYLRHLVDGHVGTIVATDSAGRDLDWSPVTVEQPVFELNLPPPAR